MSSQGTPPEGARPPDERAAGSGGARPPGPGRGRPDNTVDAFRKAENLVAQRRPLEALHVLRPVLDVAPDKPSVQLLAGRAYLFSAQFQRAELAFLRVIELDPSDHYARLALGRTLQRQGRLDEAQTQVRLAATMFPDPAYQEALGEINAHIAVRSDG